MAQVIRSGTGIILAGGKSRRFGKDKAFAPWDGKTMIEKVLSILEGLFPRVIIVTRRPSGFSFLGGGRVRVVRDLFRESHALGGLYTGLVRARTRYAFVCGCDMPLLVPELVRMIWAARAGRDAVAPLFGGRIQPLCAVYARRMAPAIRRAIGHGELRLQSLFSRPQTLLLRERGVRRRDPKGLSFLDVDTPREHARAKSIVRSLSRPSMYHRKPNA